MSTVGNTDSKGSLGEALDWNAEIEDSDYDSDYDYDIAPEGDYSFEVMNCIRRPFEGSEKLPECDKAVLTLELTGEDGKCYTVMTDIKVCKKLLRILIVPFFRAIGRLKKGGKVAMDWENIIGAKGHVRVTIYNPSGSERKYNNFEFIAP